MLFPRDSDQFLPRECPHCLRQFKWRHRESNEAPQGESFLSDTEYFCPYCYETAPSTNWWTQEQLHSIKEQIIELDIAPLLDRIWQQAQTINQTKHAFRLQMAPPILSNQKLMKEPRAMARVDFPCHLEESVKVDETWKQEVACFLCGICYPIDLVRALPEEQ